MKIRYEFANGDVMEVEVEESVGELILESRRREASLARRERRYCNSLDRVNDKSSWMLGNDNNPDHMLDQMFALLEEEERLAERKERLYKAIEKLTPRQTELIEAMLKNNATQSDFAESKGIARSTVSEHFVKAKEKIKKYF